MKLTDLERAVLREHYNAHAVCTPEELAEREGVTLGEIREAEKTALRRLDDPDHLDEAGLARLDLSRLERAVLRERYCTRRARTPEQIAESMGVTMAEVVEAEKQAMRKLEDPEHATAESLEALGLQKSA